MNDIEKAIEDLKDLSERSSISSTLFKERHGKNFNLAIAALEKQIAREPVNRCATFTIAQCPHCNGTIRFHHKHCHWCGQKIDWLEVENENGKGDKNL